MQQPKWLFFDLGSTVLTGTFEPMQGNVAILSRCTDAHGTTPEDMQRTADRLDANFQEMKAQCNLEVHIHSFQ
jgi:hypothetical protein